MAKGSSKSPASRGEYSQKRLDKAIYITKGDAEEKIAQSTAAFGEDANKFYAQQSDEQKAAILDYTGGGYRDMNKLMWTGKIEDSIYGSPGKTYVETVEKKAKAMQESISKHSLGKDVWLQRGTSGKELASIADSIGKKTLDVGDTFVYKKFVSTGTAKDTGFTDETVIMHTLCSEDRQGTLCSQRHIGISQRERDGLGCRPALQGEKTLLHGGWQAAFGFAHHILSL